MTIVVIPVSDPLDVDRSAALRFVAAKLEQLDVIVATGICPTDEWCKGAAVAQGLAPLDDDVIVVHDADVWCDGTVDAIEAVRDGAAWAVPHEAVRRLTRSATDDVLAGAPFTSHLSLDQGAYVGRAGGGITVIRRDVWEQCPMDPRFTGWGQEDDSWAIALSTLFGAPWRGHLPLWHLYHRPQPRASRIIGSEPNRQLWERYKEQRHNSDGMRALLDEMVPAWQP